jgi:ribonuclease P protein component
VSATAARPQNADVIAVPLKKHNRILKRSEFLKISEVGQRCHSKFFILLYVERPQVRARLGLIVTKKVGSAVRRNRIKRLCREYFRLNRHRWPKPYDIVLIARRTAAQATNAEIRSSLEKNFCQLPR